ncbi:unnamed protein product [Chondrus crispus]|uniref:Uncharacterized protein n=1 Tax=Chondrus crispus TaxID=2769 RepID=S0F351_CHOCR|nr:unnamed protein product [Chondrus crispus]CDF77397.1 unnamed protein product [Chondrus crispus]|eukprot:XP_005712271.1 unnamed protein product [Chondrus crispus]
MSVDCECGVHCAGPCRWTWVAVHFGPPSSAFTLVPHLLVGRIQLVLLYWCPVVMILRTSCCLLANAILHAASTFIPHCLDTIQGFQLRAMREFYMTTAVFVFLYLAWHGTTLTMMGASLEKI